MSKWLTTEEVANIDRVSVHAIHKRIQRGYYSNLQVRTIPRSMGGFSYRINLEIADTKRCLPCCQKDGIKITQFYPEMCRLSVQHAPACRLSD